MQFKGFASKKTDPKRHLNDTLLCTMMGGWLKWFCLKIKYMA